MKIKDILAIVTVAVMTGGCSSDEGTQQGGRVPIRLSASLEGGSAVWAGSSTTRAATTSTTQDTELLDGQTVAAYIKEKGGDWIANPLACTVSGNAGNLTYSGNCYYPMDATPVTIYAVHPSSATSGNAFTVNADQTQEDSYAASDLCYCKSADKNRQEAAHTLTFSHVMSKIIVNVDVSGVGITPAQAETAVTNLKLKAKTQTTITYPTGSDSDYSLSEASTPGYIAMTPGAAAIIPPQTTAAAGDVRISFDVAGIGPIAYDFPTSTEFASNTEYTYTVKVGSTITVTSSINPWGGSDTPENTYSGYVTPTNNIKNNPLWYVAQYNMAQDKTSFVTSHSTTSQYVFNFSDAALASISGYHQPTRDEQISIIPSDKLSDDGTDLFGLSGSQTSPSSFSELACEIGGTAVSASTSWWGKNGVADYYAVRFIETQYASAWHYKWVTSPCNGLLIESYLIPSSLSEAEAMTLLAGLASSNVFTGELGATGANQSPTSTASTISGFVQRFLPACGYGSSSGTNPGYQDVIGDYWSATSKDNSDGWKWFFSGSSNRLLESYDHKTLSCSVRLFINSSDPGIPMANVSSSDVGKVIASNGKIYSTVAQANSYGANPAGIIAYVGSAGSVDASNSAYKCLAIGLEDANSGNTCTWYTASSGTCVSQTDNISTAVSLKNGIACTETLVNSNGTGVTTNCSGHTHNAATIARNYSATIPSGASAWFLPSIGQWQMILQGLASKKAGSPVTTAITMSENNTYKDSNLNSVITDAGGTGFQSSGYWSSTEYSTEKAWHFYFVRGDANDDPKANSRYVRSVFAF